MRILVFGRSGQLSRSIGDVFPGDEWPGGRWDVTRLGRDQADITDEAQVRTALRDLAPDVVINTAAYTNVDRAEDEEGQAYAVNRDGAAHVARVAADRGVPLIHVSTDFVFSGQQTRPYVETDAVAPLSVYGASKEAGERAVRENTPAHVILRTAWLYSAFDGNFVTSVTRLLSERKALSMVDDQIGSPTYSSDLARALLAVSQDLTGGKAHYGTFHAAGKGAVSRFAFAQAIQDIMTGIHGPSWAGAQCALGPISAREWTARAARPAYSALDCTKLEATYGFGFPDWKESLRQCLGRFAPAAPSA